MRISDWSSDVCSSDLRFFTANILLFWLLFQTMGDPGTAGRTWIVRAFFIWVSLYNLFVVSIFWSFMADLFRSEQGKRLFGCIAAGGTAGAVPGPTLTDRKRIVEGKSVSVTVHIGGRPRMKKKKTTRHIYPDHIPSMKNMQQV